MPAPLAPRINQPLDITIELKNKRPDAKMLLEVTVDTERKMYEIRRSKEKTIRRVSKDKVYVYKFVRYYDAKGCDSACDKTKEIMVELFKYRRKHLITKDKVRILSAKVALKEAELYTKETYTGEWTSLPIERDTHCLLGEDNGATITISFAYSPRGNERYLSLYEQY